MKIWFQSCAAMGADPEVAGYEEALARQAKKAARPDTVVEFHGLDKRVPGMGLCAASSYLCQFQATRNAFRAEREGYDAFAVVCMESPGYSAIKQAVNIPAVFIAETAIHTALVLAPRFAFFVHAEALLLQLNEFAKALGITERMVLGDHLGLKGDQIQDLFKGAPEIVERAKKVGSQIVDRGADILIPASNVLSTFLVEQGIREIAGARVLDSFGCLLKTTELMVDFARMGITRSRHGLFAAPSSETLESIRKIYEAHRFV